MKRGGGEKPMKNLIEIRGAEVVLDERFVSALMLNGVEFHAEATETILPHGDVEFYLKAGRCWVRNARNLR
jgi:hypothetical protein